jgi:hypothetical protein
LFFRNPACAGKFGSLVLPVNLIIYNIKMFLIVRIHKNLLEKR